MDHLVCFQGAQKRWLCYSMWQNALVPGQNMSELSYFNMRQIQANQLVSAWPLAVFLKIELILPYFAVVHQQLEIFLAVLPPPTNSTPLENPLRGPRVNNALADWDCRYMVYPIASHLNVGYDDNPLGSNMIQLDWDPIFRTSEQTSGPWQTLTYSASSHTKTGPKSLKRLLRPDVPIFSNGRGSGVWKLDILRW